MQVVGMSPPPLEPHLFPFQAQFSASLRTA